MGVPVIRNEIRHYGTLRLAVGAVLGMVAMWGFVVAVVVLGGGN